MGLIRILAPILLILVWASAGSAQRNVLLIDRSGSMGRYFGNGTVQLLGSSIANVMREQSSTETAIAAFNDHVEVASSLERIQPSGPTHLDVALNYAVTNHYSIAWLISDNIMHRSGEEEGKTEIFYEGLKQPAVKRVVIFPFKQQAGSGNAGIVVYALLLSSDQDELFKKATVAFGAAQRQTTLLPMKPLDRDTIETIFIEPPKDKKIDAKIYSDGSEISDTMELRFKSKFDHLRVLDGDIVNEKVAPEFSENSLLDFERDKVEISPKKIIELGPHNETIQVYTVKVDLGRLRLKRDFISLWRAALKDPNEEIRLDLSFSIKIPKDKFQFTEEFLTNYSSDTPERAQAEGKIFALNRLPLLVADNQTAIEVPYKPKIRVRYPSWLFVIFPGIPILAVLLVIGLSIVGYRVAKGALKKGPKWKVEVLQPQESRARLDGGRLLINNGSKQHRLGQIKGKSLVPGTGVTPKVPQVIKEGVTMRLTAKKTDFVIIFRLSSNEERSGSNRKVKVKNGKRSNIKI